MYRTRELMILIFRWLLSISISNIFGYVLQIRILPAFLKPITYEITPTNCVVHGPYGSDDDSADTSKVLPECLRGRDR